MEILQEAASAQITKPLMTSAKQVRNLFAYFTPGREEDAFEKLSLLLVESAANELNKWILEMESALGLLRHPDSEAIVREFVNQMGATTTLDVSSDPDKCKVTRAPSSASLIVGLEDIK